MIRLMKASAGAGKTWNLAQTYIRLLLEKRQDRYAYRHILAVTFTNKATAEMKNRILKELYILSGTPQESAYCQDFVPSLFPSAVELGRASRAVLSDILHDYSAFAVSTIDKFFQQTLKAFSREIGQFASYQVELDRKSLVTESVERLLDSVTEKDSALLEWLKVNVLEQIERGGKYKVDADLDKIAQHLLSAERQEALEEMEKSGMDIRDLYSKEKLSRTKSVCKDIIDQFEGDVKRLSLEVLSILDSAGISVDQTKGNFLRVMKKYAGQDYLERPSATFFKYAADKTQWLKKDAQGLLYLIEGRMETPLMTFASLFDAPFIIYNTAKVINGQLFGMGVAAELSETFRFLMKERNVLCLDDSNTILRNIIDGSDAPFIYEKIGVRFENFLLDEFQDTSKVQWENFYPLLAESNSKGEENLIVGDVKQSIYRWRGSDWKLFNEGIRKAFNGEGIEDKNLPSNFRSLRDIVKFNNGFFQHLARQLDVLSGRDQISDIYRQVAQKVGRKDSEEGSVEATFCDAGNELSVILEAVESAMSQGASAGDIAVLVRTNVLGERIAGALIDAGYPVITDDSLKVKSSVIVRRLVALLSYVDNPVDKIAAYMVSALDIRIPDNCHSLMDLAENLYRQLREGASAEDLPLFDGEVLHVQSFMDALQDYISLNGNDLRGFLKDWENQDPSISSPSAGNSIRVMTVHKSKGLDFPYVILPYLEKIEVASEGAAWCRPDLEGTPLEDCADGLYHVTLSGKSTDTLFAGDYEEERFLQMVDNANLLYVAMTRASKGMHLIGVTPKPDSKSLTMAVYLWRYFNDGCPDMVEAYDEGDPAALFAASDTPEVQVSDREDGAHFLIGVPYDFNAVHQTVSPEGNGAPVMSYPSYPLNPGEGDPDTDVRERGRLKFSADAVDFFSPQGDTGAAASHRIKGIVLHDILSGVLCEGDLPAAVAGALADGTLSAEEADETERLLSDRIASVRGRGWFPDNPDAVRNEVSVIDTDGCISRPDRVVISDGKVIIIDYKFGQHEKKYERQVRAYASLYRRMGWNDISCFLWYVLDNEIREV